jgi:hypothetical protein
MPERRSSLTPTYTFNARSQRYRHIATGRWVGRDTVRRALDTTLQRSQADMTRLGRDLQAGRLTLAEWQVATAKSLKAAHLASAAAARGGWAQMTQADYGRVGHKLRGEYGFLARFAQAIADGAQPLDGRFLTRLSMYAQAPRGTYHDQERAGMREAGYTEERNVLGMADHCDSCRAQTARGWVALGSLIPVGQRDCLTSCKCSVQYRKS